MRPAGGSGQGRRPGETAPDKQKGRSLTQSAFWWGMVDSNHRRHRQQIYSLSPLATREIPHVHMNLELVDGFEPPTC